MDCSTSNIFLNSDLREQQFWLTVRRQPECGYMLQCKFLSNNCSKFPIHVYEAVWCFFRQYTSGFCSINHGWVMALFPVEFGVVGSLPIFISASVSRLALVFRLVPTFLTFLVQAHAWPCISCVLCLSHLDSRSCSHVDLRSSSYLFLTTPMKNNTVQAGSHILNIYSSWSFISLSFFIVLCWLLSKFM